MYHKHINKLVQVKKISSIGLVLSSSLIYKAEEKTLPTTKITMTCEDGLCEIKKKTKQKPTTLKIMLMEMIDLIVLWISSLAISQPIAKFLKPENGIDHVLSQLVQFFFSSFSILSNLTNTSVGRSIFGYTITKQDDSEAQPIEMTARSIFSFVELGMLFLKNGFLGNTSKEYQPNLFEAVYGLILLSTEFYFILTKKRTFGDELAGTKIVKKE
eukprot:gene4330-7686_t